MWTTGVSALWRSEYRRAVRSAFDTVPFYRERWALDGRTQPTLVPGRTGTRDGAVTPDDAARAMVDLVPLAGGAARPDPVRGLGSVLPHARPLRRDTLVVVADPEMTLPPADLGGRMRGCVLDPEALLTDEPAMTELTNALLRKDSVVAVGPDKGLAALDSALRADLPQRLDRVPHRTLAELDGGPYGLIHDPQLGYLGAFHRCGRWHLDWRRVYVRSTRAGLAVTLLRQESPRMVDVLVAGGVAGKVASCPRHGTPVVLT
ncbi:hypothetical protein SAMN05216266_107195 [Amycolatopsis marina]|uniref:Uncharacterized protein n=1 Tax=Amycolatopsis marina TaxID=490629 RepID=A0A1I0ZU91_9PSEU|nr:hypothetical protein [Amycolatopsis marina]SFB27793.1 hypothetical protein SAMN05216266_107195 [Amycolatopsis marina]